MGNSRRKGQGQREKKSWRDGKGTKNKLYFSICNLKKKYKALLNV